jgi:hypothetical protein
VEQALAPEEQMWLDLGQLIRDQVPGKDGKTIPPEVTSGVYQIKDLSHVVLGPLYEAKLIVDKTNGHAFYGCYQCCGDDGAVMGVVPIDVFVNGTLGQTVWSASHCDGGPYNINSAMTSWWTNDATIATASNAQVHGVAAGSTDNLAEGEISTSGFRQCGQMQGRPSGPTNVVSVEITGADLENNQVSVTLSGPSGTSGTLEVVAVGVSNQPQVTYNGGAAVGPGSYNVAFNRPTWPSDTYSSVKAIWNYGPIPATKTFNLTRAWLVLGLVRHSQYNTPYESACSGSPQAAWYFNTSCNFTQVSLKSDFVSQTYINGTGASQSYGILKYSTSCSNYPSGANSQNSFLAVSSITGACNTTLVGGTSVATYPSPSVGNPYGCGDNILLVTSSNTNEAVKDAADYCPACSGGFNGTNGHIDDYSSSQACSGSGVGDLGNFWTADTH